MDIFKKRKMVYPEKIFDCPTRGQYVQHNNEDNNNSRHLARRSWHQEIKFERELEHLLFKHPSSLSFKGTTNDRERGSLKHVDVDDENLSNNQHTHSYELNELGSSDNEQFIRERLKHLVGAFTERTLNVKDKIEYVAQQQVIDRSVSCELIDRLEFETIQQETIIQAATRTRNDNNNCDMKWGDVDGGDGIVFGVLDPQGVIYISWLFIVSISYLYNCWTIPLRSTFPYQTKETLIYWMLMDYVCDMIYLIDIVLFEPRVMYLHNGFWINQYKLTNYNYHQKLQFKFDVISLLPTDLFYLWLGVDGTTWLRLPRLFKLHAFKQSIANLDSIILSSPHIVRVARTLTYMLYLIHITACAYYAFSKYEGLNSNQWTYNNQGNAYIRCFYFATKTATSIGKNPKPENEIEYLFMTIAWLMGVFVFALLIGQIRDIIATATRLQTEYVQLIDDTLAYMRRCKLPNHIQHRVKMWFTYTWQTQHCLNENMIMDCLPQKTKLDIALDINYNLLCKVSLFKDCNDDALLRELVLKLRSVIYLPADIICRCGDVGYEMYIVKTGHLQVLGGKDNNEVLASLKEGSVFGEISLLAINNANNRRTATVQSVGFSNLFVLSKNDLNDTLVNYPHAQQILKDKAEAVMIKNQQNRLTLNQPIIIINQQQKQTSNQNTTSTTNTRHQQQQQQHDAKIIQTVLDVMPKESGCNQLLNYGSKKYFKLRQQQQHATRVMVSQHTFTKINDDDDMLLINSSLNQTNDDNKSINSFDQITNEIIVDDIRKREEEEERVDLNDTLNRINRYDKLRSESNMIGSCRSLDSMFDRIHINKSSFKH